MRPLMWRRWSNEFFFLDVGEPLHEQGRQSDGDSEPGAKGYKTEVSKP